MTFDQVEKHIDITHGKRIPQGLNEMMWCQPLANYLNAHYATHYDNVYKNEELDRQGIDVVLSSKKMHAEHVLYIQLTHAREYDMSPSVEEKTIDLTGNSIIEAVDRKCTHYMNRGIDTEKLVLIIQGILPESYVNELMSEDSFIQKFKEVDCFDGIYYISDKVYPLKEINE